MNKSNAIRIVVIDDQKLFLELIEQHILTNNKLELVKTFQSGEDFFESIRLGLRVPDILLLDLEIPSHIGSDGFQIAQKIKKDSLEIRIICMSVNNQSHVLRKLINDIKVDGFIDKNNDSLLDLNSIIEVVANGYFYIDKNLEKRARRILGIEQLTPREKQVTQLISNGLTNKEIAQKLELSVKTIDNHKQSIFSKLNCRKSSELTQKYFKYLYLQSDNLEMLPNFKKNS